MSNDLRERFLATPLVTRCLGASLWCAVVLNVVFGLDDMLCASPHDILKRLQLWRLITSVLYVPGVISALFLSFVLYRIGSAWEKELGSLRFAWYLVVIGVCVTNLTTCVLAILLSPLMPHLMQHTFVCAPGIQNALFVMFTKITQAYPGAGINVANAFTVQKQHVPLFLFCVFCLLGAHPVEGAACVSIGVLWSNGRLQRISKCNVLPSDLWYQQMERSRRISTVVNQPGYVSTVDAGPSLPGVSAGDQTTRGFLQHVRDHAWEESGSGSGGDANRTGFQTSGGARGRRLGESGGAPRGPPQEPEPAHWRTTGQPEGGSSGSTGGGAGSGAIEGPSNSYSQQVSSVSTANAPPREASVSGAGTAQNRNETQVPRNKKKEESREARAAALALAHEKRLKQEQGNTEGDLR